MNSLNDYISDHSDKWQDEERAVPGLLGFSRKWQS